MMAIPTAYTDFTLRSYMAASLGTIAETLGLDQLSFVEAANDVLLAYGVDDVAAATDVGLLRALARVEALRVAEQAVALSYDFSADGASFDRSQMAARVAALLVRAEADAARLGGGGAAWSVGVGSLGIPGDPYRFGYEVEDDDEAEGVG